jgi:DNA-binding transcriptional LysR family regulator
VVACLPEHALAKAKSVTWERLAKADYLAFGLDSGIGQQLSMSQRLPGSPYEVQHSGTMLGLVQAGFGVGVVPYSTIHGNPSLIYRPLRQPKVMRTIGIIRRRGSSLSPAAENLLQISVRTIAETYRALPEAELLDGAAP